MEPKCRKIILRLLFALAFMSFVVFVIFCVLDLKPYLEAKNYVQTSCIMDSKDQNAGEGECSCGRRCTDTQPCGAAYVNVPSTGVTHTLISLDETETSSQCTVTGGDCGFPYDINHLPSVGSNFSCLYDPDKITRIIWHHQAKSFLLPALIVPACLFVIFAVLFGGMCYFWTCKKNGLSISSGDTGFGFSRFNNQTI